MRIGHTNEKQLQLKSNHCRHYYRNANSDFIHSREFIGFHRKSKDSFFQSEGFKYKILCRIVFSLFIWNWRNKIFYFQRLETLFNPRLENVLQQRAANLTPTTDPTPVAAPHTADTQEVKPESNESKAEVKILKGLQGLSPAILAMIKAKEQARQIKKMTLTNEEQKELELMEELISVRFLFVAKV